MSHSSVCEDAASSANPWINVPKWTSTDFPAQGVGSNEHCRDHINRNRVHARSTLLTSWLFESSVLTKRDMQNMQSGGGGMRTGNRWSKQQSYAALI